MYLGGGNDMNTAVIIAGGRGVRMGKDVPKQFILLDGKPIIIGGVRKTSTD